MALNWLKEEIYDMDAMLEAISSKEALDKQRTAMEAKKKSDEATLQKLNVGKKTLKTLFKSKSGKEGEKEKVQAAIEQGQRDIENLEAIVKFVTIYIAEVQIPWFKKKKEESYKEFLKNFCIEDMRNAILISGTLENISKSDQV